MTCPDHVSAVPNVVSLVTVKRESDPAQGLNAAVAAVLNGERVAAGMTFDQLADASGISKQQLLRLLSTTKRHISLEVLDILAPIFVTTPGRIIASAEERMARSDPDAYAAIRRNQRLSQQLTGDEVPSQPTGTDQTSRRARRPS